MAQPTEILPLRMGETSPLLPGSSRMPSVRNGAGHVSKPGHVSIWRVVCVFVLLVIPLFLLADVELPDIPWFGRGPMHHDMCPQVEEMHPKSKVAARVLSAIETPEFLFQAVGALSGAVKIATQTFDVMGNIGEDPVWDVFQEFHTYLYGAFPLVHQHLNLTKINTYGLVYEWTGSDSTLKPVLLAAHQDTVPVNPTTIHDWTYPPWSGHYDGEWIWGRGSVDDKAALISILMTIETMLLHPVKPRRSVVLAFGFDEEISGGEGAGKLAPYLEHRYGTDGFSLIIDEGSGMQEMFGAVFAAPAIGEKGYLDTRIEVTTPGGHSSIPPASRHTGIGILSQIIVMLENNTIPHRLSRSQPIYESLKCVGQHGPDIPSTLKRAIEKSTESERALHRVEELVSPNDQIRSIIGTTQAVDVIQGGVKSNALPEQSWAIVNSRIATDSTVSTVMSHYTSFIKDFAIANNITFIAFGNTILDRGSIIKIEISDAWGTALEPAPVSPIDAEPYKLLSGTILATESRSRNGSDSLPMFVMPSVMSGNTDTRRYWNLTSHIFRYSHARASDVAGIHTVDEHIRATGLVGQIRFFVNLLFNADESTSLE